MLAQLVFFPLRLIRVSVVQNVTNGTSPNPEFFPYPLLRWLWFLFTSFYQTDLLYTMSLVQSCLPAAIYFDLSSVTEIARKHDDWSVSGIGMIPDYTRQFVYKICSCIKNPLN